MGRAFVYRERLESLAGAQEIEHHQVEGEVLGLERALETVAQDLATSATRFDGEADNKLTAILQAQREMLLDPSLLQEIRTLIREGLYSGAWALSHILRRWERRFQELTEATLRQRADDIADLRRRLLRELAGVKATSLERMPPGHVLVARRLLPSDTIALPRRAVTGIVVESGGPGSHAAILAEALGIPTVSQIPTATTTIADEDELIVDGLRGEVVLYPEASTREYYNRQILELQTRSTTARLRSREPARTLDGTKVSVLANVSCREDIEAAAQCGADGVGLYRIEQYYLTRNTPPSAAELLAELRAAFEPMRGKPLTVRLVDLGGDKPLPFFKLPAEENPFLGQRGVRFLLRYPELLEAQLHALCHFAQEEDLRVLIPMVTLPEELVTIRSRLVAVAKDTGCQRLPPLGAMIETPAAALSITELKLHADFLSVGTNDLTQYTMAAGRENPLVNDYFREDHPSILRLLRIILEEAGTTPVGLCGELARRLQSIPTLLALGLRSLSVPPPMVPAVKQTIRQLTL
jgi:phosphotransferase system enzyme I (PtsI)